MVDCGEANGNYKGKVNQLTEEREGSFVGITLCELVNETHLTCDLRFTIKGHVVPPHFILSKHLPWHWTHMSTMSTGSSSFEETTYETVMFHMSFFSVPESQKVGSNASEGINLVS